MLPDLPNLTELVSGVYDDGTPVFSKTTPARSRFAAPTGKGRARRQPNHIPVDSVPIPEEERAIFASLHLLQEKVAQLEHERAEAEKKIEEQEVEIIELRAAERAQDKETTNNDTSGKNTWKVEKTREFCVYPSECPMLTEVRSRSLSSDSAEKTGTIRAETFGI
jgi:hypothetical protein